ncbi:MAG: hypothetical protein KDK70_43320, partial [Myxococcales bacterium]|nr:hypothetical protein [Myxococcales bacterium]
MGALVDHERGQGQGQGAPRGLEVAALGHDPHQVVGRVARDVGGHGIAAAHERAPRAAHGLLAPGEAIARQRGHQRA